MIINFREKIRKLFNHSVTNDELASFADYIESGNFESEWLKKQWEESKSSINPQIALTMRSKMGHLKGKRNHYFTLGWGAVAAVVALLIVTYFFVYSGTIREFSTDTIIAYEPGQAGCVVLPDGTKVWVNAGSELRFGTQFTTQKRVVKLNGEAYFEVAKNPDAPFVVETDLVSVRAVGTSFNVKAYADDSVYSVVLVEGEVITSDGINQINLLPDQKISFSKSERKLEKTNVTNSELITNWRNDQLSFESESFAGIAKTLERKYGVSFVFLNEELKHIKYTGSLKVNKLEDILQIISLTSPFNYQQYNDTVLLSLNP